MITASQWRQAVMPVLGDESGWAWRGKLVYRSPVDWVLLGVHAEGSGFRRDQVYVAALWMPLFVPSDHLVLTHAERVPSGTATVGLADESDLVATVQRALARLPTQREALQAIADSAVEESAYALVLLGSPDLARDRLAEPWAPGDDRPFVVEKRRRRSEIAQVLDAHGQSAAEDLLRCWRDATASSLKVA